MVSRNKFLSQSTQHCKRLLPVTWLKAMSIAMVLSDGGRVPKIGFGRGQIPLPAFCESIATDYVEACRVLLASAKASAALSRRCLQVMVHDQGYKNRGPRQTSRAAIECESPSPTHSRNSRCNP